MENICSIVNYANISWGLYHKEEMRHLDLFSGIGGFALAASWVWPDHEVVAFVEIDPFCQKVLEKHWPGVKIHGDIRSFADTDKQRREEGKRGHALHAHRSNNGNGKSIDLLTGGFPCQPFSHAGKRKGREDERHLWPEMLRVIRNVRPRWVVAENVSGLLSQEGGVVFEQVLADLEAEGYEVQPVVIPACGVNAPHRRDRVWIVAHRNGTGSRTSQSSTDGNGQAIGEEQEQSQSERGGHNRHAPDTEHKGLQGGERRRRADAEGREEPDGPTPQRYNAWDQDWYTVALRTCVRPLDDGLPGGLVRPKGWRVNALKAAGNSIVPQVAYQIFKAIQEVDPMPQGGY